MTLLLRASLRHHLQHPLQTTLCLLGIALGVAVAIAIDLSVTTSQRALTHSTQTLANDSSHHVLAGPTGLPHSLYTHLRTHLNLPHVSPLLEHDVSLPQHHTSLHLTGIDPLATPLLSSTPNPDLDPTLLLTHPLGAILSADTARTLDLQPGDTFPILANDRTHTLTLLATLQPTDPSRRTGLQRLLLVDLATAQHVTGRTSLSRLDLDLDPQHLQLLPPLLPQDAHLVDADTLSQQLDGLTRAFRLNLRALSYLALLVGTFLIFNTMTFSVVQRRPLFGRLRARGAPPRTLQRLITLEALSFGALGATLGLPLGIILARYLAPLTARTVSDLYAVVAVDTPDLDLTLLARAFALGLAATWLASLRPAREAALAPPHHTLDPRAPDTRTRTTLLPRAALALWILALSATLLTYPSHDLRLAFLSLLGLNLGAAALAPLVIAAVAALTLPLTRPLGFTARLASRSLSSHLARTGPAVASLAIAIAMAVAISVTISSFRLAVDQWLRHTLHADLYVTLPHPVTRVAGPSTLDPDLVDHLTSLPQVRAHSSNRTVDASSNLGPLRLTALSLDTTGLDPFTLLHTTTPDPLPLLRHDAFLASEPFAYHHGLHPGDTLTLHTPSGPQPLTLAATFSDYASDTGYVVLHEDLFLRLFPDPGRTALALYLHPDADPSQLAASLRDPTSAVQFQPQSQLLDTSLQVFDRTFLVTRALRVLAALVAVLGVLGALASLTLERKPDMAVLRARGLPPNHLLALLTLETSLLGLAAAALALPLGLACAYVLTSIINLRSFGWTIPLQLPPSAFLEGALLSVLAAVLAGLLPARAMAHTPPAAALRPE